MAEDTRNRDYPEYSKPAREPANDPLAELARLIGQSDPFTDVKRSPRKPLDSMKNLDRPAPEWLARPAAPEADEDYAPLPKADAHGSDFYEQPHDGYDAHDYQPEQEPPGHAHEEPRYAPQRATAPAQQAYATYNNAAEEPAAEGDDYDDRYRVARPGSAEYEDGYYDGHMPPGEEAPPRKRGALITIAAVVGLAVIGTAGAFGYRAYTSGPSLASEPPVIKADPTPPKTVIAPPPAPSADAQGKPFQDRVGAAQDKVVPREEQPVALPIAPSRSAAAMTAPAPAAAAPAPLVAPAPPANVNEPKRVRTMTIRPDAPDGTPTASVAAPQAPNQNATAPAPKQAQSAKQTGPMTINPHSEPSSRTKVAVRTPPAQAAGGAYVVQVSAQRTEAEAQSSYRALQQKYPAVLGSREPNIRRVDLGDRGGVFFRAQVGSFATAEAANDFCTNLKNAGGQCIVQKN